MIDEQHNRAIARQFVRHEATTWEVPADGPIGCEVRRIRWARPGSMVNRVDFLSWPGTLFVSGDLGGAVYSFHRTLSLEGLANSNLSYFASKCEASEDGRGFESWDADRALGWLLDYCWNGVADPSGLLEIPGFVHRVYSREDWINFLEGFGDEFGDDYWEWAPSIGMAPSPRCRFHWLGLRCALHALGLWRTDAPPIPGWDSPSTPLDEDLSSPATLPEATRVPEAKR